MERLRRARRAEHRDSGEDGERAIPTPEEAGPGADVERRAPDAPTKLPKRAWVAVLKGSVREFGADELTDRAAALTYYGVLSLFPGLLVVVSLLGFAGGSTVDAVLRTVRPPAPGAARDIVTEAVEELRGKAGAGSVIAVVGLVLAL